MKILVADDDPVARLLLRSLLTEPGVEVIDVATGEEALEHLTGPGRASLAILDWMMPGLSGVDLCRKLKAEEEGKALHLILLTSRGEIQDIVEGLRAGADDFIVKPYDPEELYARVKVGRRLVTMQQQLEEANRRLEERVRERTRQVERLLEQNRSLLRSVSHDLRTPLTPLLSLVPMLLESEENPERRVMLELVQGGAASIHHRVERVMRLRRITEGMTGWNPAPLELRGLVTHVLQDAQENSGWDERQAVNAVPPDLVVFADTLLAQEALGHLVDNAVKFSGSKGRIEVGVRTVAGAVTVVVKDDGIGLQPEDLARVFEPFFKVDPSRHDHLETGLGLSLAKAIAELHGGRIWGESEGPGKGASFCLTLPLAELLIERRAAA